MEKEQFYIFVIYNLNVRIDPVTRNVYLYDIDIKRCAKTKGPQNERNKHKRIKVSFDPINCENVWVLYALVDKKEKGKNIKGDLSIIGIYLNEAEAVFQMNMLKTTDFQELIDKNETIKQVEIINLPIIDD